MKTITDSLKNFYAKLGGNPSNLPSRSTSADIIDAMSDVYTDKEGTHVEVTTQVTEGTKIATVKTNNVDHDIYAPKEVRIIELSSDPNTEGRFLLPEEMTNADLRDIIANGTFVYLKVNMDLYVCNFFDFNGDYLYFSSAQKDTIYTLSGNTYGTNNYFNKVRRDIPAINPNWDIRLKAGDTSVSITDEEHIYEGHSIFAIHTMEYGVEPTNYVVDNHTLTITFDVQQEDLKIYVEQVRWF